MPASSDYLKSKSKETSGSHSRLHTKMCCLAILLQIYSVWFCYITEKIQACLKQATLMKIPFSDPMLDIYFYS